MLGYLTRGGLRGVRRRAAPQGEFAAWSGLVCPSADCLHWRLIDALRIRIKAVLTQVCQENVMARAS
jgi:hypothetical protein